TVRGHFAVARPARSDYPSRRRGLVRGAARHPNSLRGPRRAPTDRRNVVPPRFPMTFQTLLIGLVDRCWRGAWRVVIAGGALAVFAAWYAAGHLGISTDTDLMFAESLPWRQRAITFRADFPQFRDLLVAVIDAGEPEEAEATAAALAEALIRDRAHFISVR